MASVISHFEVYVDDLERAKKFYSDVFGWAYQDMGPELNDYVVVYPGGEVTDGPATIGINGGMMKRPGPASSDDTAAPNASCVGVAPNGDVYITCVPTSTGQFAALYRSTDHGATWTDIADDNYRNSAILARSVAARNDGTVLVATNGCGVLVYDEPVMKAQMS